MILRKFAVEAKSFRTHGVKQKPVSKLQSPDLFRISCPECGSEIGSYHGNGKIRCPKKHEYEL